MSEMVERVAMIIGGDRQKARAVIEAMREPTRAMVEAADSEQFEEVWKEMIDEALRETP